MPAEGKVKTNEDYWINLAAESIYNTPDKLIKSAETLKTVIAWAFGIFSASGFALSVFGEVKTYNLSSLIFFGTAFAILIIGYVLAAVAQYPVAKTYNDSDPVEIKLVFNAANVKQIGYFRIASLVTFIGFFILALGILIQFYHMKDEKIIPSCPQGLVLKTSIEKRGKQLYVPVTISFHKNKLVEVLIYSLLKNDKDTIPDKLLSQNVFYTDSSGNIYYSYALPTDTIKNIMVKGTAFETSNDTTTEKSVTIKLGMEQ